MSDVSPLTAGSRGALPPPCVDCVFWQHDRLLTDGRRKDAWVDAIERRHGAFGHIMRDGDGFRGMVQYGPAEAFPRALALPSGPPGRDAALITCCYLEGDDPRGVCERLFLEALAALKGRGATAVEAFALSHPDDVPTDERFLGHHTLFDHGFLEALGFAPVRSSGPVALMRIDLRTLIAAPGLVSRATRATRAARALLWPQPSGAPA